MSTGDRMPLATATRIAASLFQRWELDPLTCFTVGSVRREAPTVGDIEIAAPLPKGWNDKKIAFDDDPIFKRINATMKNRIVGHVGLFEPIDVPGLAGATPTIGASIRGLKPGFRAASIELHLTSGHKVGVQVFRYTPENFGWLMIERTGPGGPKGFGAYFLEAWKKQHGIPLGEDNPASVDNHLVNRAGDVVPVPTEDEAFRLCGFKMPVPPNRRDAFAEAIWKGRDAR